MKENFKINLSKRIQKGNCLRTYLEVECSEGHVSEIRQDTFITLNNCKYCQEKYYKCEEYNVLDSMIQRCYNPNNKSYKNYGARGITVCDEWMLKGYFGVRNLIRDIGKRPTGLTIDRIDVNGNYEPSNCRWVTASMQGFNQRRRVTNTSGRTGVQWKEDKKKYHASITYNNINLFLGYSSCFENAVKLREEAELKYFGKVKE